MHLKNSNLGMCSTFTRKNQSTFGKILQAWQNLRSCMKVAERIIACENLETWIYFLKIVEIMTPSITKLMNETEENFSAFDSIEKVIGPTEEEAT